LAGEFDVFFTKFNEDGSALAYSTYFGGSGEEGEGNYCGIAADASGCAYVTSGTFSEDFPTTEGAFQGDYADNGDAFVFKFCKIAPTVATSAATDVTADSATLNMSYTLGEYSAVEVRFAYKKSADSTWSYTSWVTDPGSPYSELISGLDSDTQYDFKAQLRYDSTVIEGDVLQFTTGSAAQTPLLPPPGPRVSPSLTPPSLPATNVRLLNVGVSPGQAQAGQPVTVTANIVNEGASAGSYNAALRINGRVEQQRVVEVSPGTAYPVKFTVAKSQPGKYEVAVENQRASFVVLAANSASKAPASSGLIALVIIGLLVLATAVVLVMAFRKFA